MPERKFRPGDPCVVDGCPRQRFCKAMCKPHYRKMEKYGDPLGGPGRGGKRQDEVARFWAMVDKNGPGGCWLWTGGLNQHGYANFWLDGKTVRASRFAYALLVGPIPAGLQLDHVWDRGCRHKHCVNPSHLEPVSAQINNARSTSPSAKNAAKTHCDYGHEFTTGNTYLWRGKRHCRTCIAINSAMHKLRGIGMTSEEAGQSLRTWADMIEQPK